MLTHGRVPDGSSFYQQNENFVVYGQAGLKFSGRGAHDIRATRNLYAYVDTAFNGNPGHFSSFASADGWFVNNTVILGGNSTSYFGAGYPSDCVLVGQPPERGKISGNAIHTQHPVVVPCLNASATIVTDGDRGDGCNDRAKLGAGLRIHGSGKFTDLFVPDAEACCRACLVPHCSTWCFGWGNGTGCHLSTGPPVSTTKDPKFAGGTKGPPVPVNPRAKNKCTATCKLTEWLAEGHDLGTTVGPLPKDDTVIAAAKKLLGMS